MSGNIESVLREIQKQYPAEFERLNKIIDSERAQILRMKQVYDHNEIEWFAGNKSKTTATVPGFINNKPVTVINTNAFLSQTLQEVVLPETIKHIKSKAFGNNPNLKRVVCKGSIDKIAVEDKFIEGKIFGT